MAYAPKALNDKVPTSKAAPVFVNPPSCTNRSIYSCLPNTYFTVPTPVRVVHVNANFNTTKMTCQSFCNVFLLSTRIMSYIPLMFNFKISKPAEALCPAGVLRSLRGLVGAAPQVEVVHHCPSGRNQHK